MYVLTDARHGAGKKGFASCLKGFSLLMGGFVGARPSLGDMYITGPPGWNVMPPCVTSEGRCLNRGAVSGESCACMGSPCIG